MEKPQGKQAQENVLVPPSNTLRVGTLGVFEPLDPFTRISGYSSHILSFVFEGLMDFAKDGTFQPMLAQEISLDDSSDDFDIWRVKLKSGVEFHNGQPLTVADVRASLECAMQESTGSWAYSRLQSIKRVAVLNEREIALYLEKGAQPVWFGLAIAVVPTSDNPCNKKAEPSQFINSTGPYRVAKWSSDHVLLKRHENYWGGKPKINQISFTALKSKKLAWTQLMRSDLDVFWYLNSDEKRITKDQPHLQVVSFQNNFFYMLVFNMNNEDLQDVRVRRALNLAVDREAIIERVLRGDAELSSGIMNPDLVSHGRGITPYPYDPERALRLLQQSGFHYDRVKNELKKDNKVFKLQAVAFQGDAESKQLMLAVQAHLQEIGIRLAVRTVELDKMMENVKLTNDHLFHIYSRAYSEPASLHRYFSGGEESLFPYRNAKMSRLFQKHAAGGFAKREDFLKAFSQQLFEEPPGIFLYWKKIHVALHARVKGADINPGNFWGDITQWYIDEDWQGQSAKIATQP